LTTDKAAAIWRLHLLPNYVAKFLLPNYVAKFLLPNFCCQCAWIRHVDVGTFWMNQGTP
jgi:hypothetical protein